MTNGRTTRATPGEIAALPRLGAGADSRARDDLRFEPAPLAAIIAVLALALCLASFAFVDEPAARHAGVAFARYRGVARVFTDLGLSGYMLIGSAAIGGGAYLMRRKETRLARWQGLNAVVERSAFVFATVAISGLLAQFLKHVLGRARPKLIDTVGAMHFDLFSIKASLASFPSGHTTSAFALATALALMLPALRWPLLTVACAVGVSRYAVGAHYVSDIIGGAALGSIVTLLCIDAFAVRGSAFVRSERGVALKDPGTVWPLLGRLRDARRSRS